MEAKEKNKENGRKYRHSKLNSLLSIFISTCLVMANISMTAFAADAVQAVADTEIDTLDAIVSAHERIPTITDVIVIILGDLDNVKNSEDYLGSVFFAGRRADGRIRSGLILVNGTFVEGIMNYDKTFIPGTIDENNLFVSNEPVYDNQKLICYIDENGYPLAATATQSTATQTTTTQPTKDAEPKTGDSMLPLATLGMIAGMAYLLDYFADKKGLCLGMTKAQKDKVVSFLVGKAKGKNKFIRMGALAIIFLILVFYHSIGKIVEVDGLEMGHENAI